MTTDPSTYITHIITSLTRLLMNMHDTPWASTCGLCGGLHC